MRKHIPSGVWELFIPGIDAGDALQVRGEVPRRACRREVRSVRLRRRGAAAHGQHRHRPRHAISGTTPTGSPAGRSTTRSTRRCRSTKSTWAAGGAIRAIPSGWLNYRELAPQLVEYCQEMGYTHVELLPVSEHPVHRQLGLSDGRLLRRHQPLRHAARFHVLRRLLPPARHRRDSSTGCRPTSRKDDHGLRRFDGTALLRARRPAQGRASRLGHDDLQLRPQRGPQLPALQRPVLARQVPHRRPARRCGGLDAVPRLQPQGRRVGSQLLRRPREPRSDSTSSRSSTSKCTCSIPAC